MMLRLVLRQPLPLPFRRFLPSLLPSRHFSTAAKTIIPAPRTLPALPLHTRPLFPSTSFANLVVAEAPAAAALLAMRDKGRRHVGLFFRRGGGETEIGFGAAGVNAEANAGDCDKAIGNGVEALHRVGVMAEIVAAAPRAPGVELTLRCHHRVRWTEVAGTENGEEKEEGDMKKMRDGKEEADLVKDDRLLMVKIEAIAEREVDAKEQTIKALTFGIVEVMKESLEVGSFFKDQIEVNLPNIALKSPAALADLGASLTTADAAKLQEVLEEENIEERLRKSLTLLKTDLETTRVLRKISEGIEKNVSDSQKRFFLNEQLKQIKKELGMDKDEKSSLVVKFRARLEDKVVPAAAQTLIDDSIEKLESLDPSGTEFAVVRAHLDWLSQIPWGKFSDDILDLERAKDVLENDHCGLKDVKERVLEFIAVSKLRGSVHGNIILLSGPPGTGKTSVAASVAKALGREFYRFSVGGLGDVSELKGHRRTYVGALPGRFVVALKAAKTSNCVICLDEIDKLAGFRGFGSPSSVLLETLDPEQNSQFVDQYIDTPIDLSKVLFICTANSVDTIPGPLLDRMQHIKLEGYILEEKKAIALSHLIPVALKATGLDSEVAIEESAIEALARDYCREAGVRNLKKHIEMILRKVALQVATAREADGSGAEQETIRVTEDTLESYVGKPVFSKDNLYESGFPPGVAKGLAWTELGGKQLHIETVRVADRAMRAAANSKSLDIAVKNGELSRDGRIKVSGNLGDVMKESTDIAFSYVRNLLQRIDAKNDFFDTAFVHIHVPDGGTPKDGPSAGCAMVTAMLSLSRGVPVPADVAMTGEISLTGKVLPVGGILSKVIAAKQGGVKRIILPKGNEKDWAEIPEAVRDGLDVHFAEQFEEDVLPVCFPDFAGQELSSFPHEPTSPAAAVAG